LLTVLVEEKKTKRLILENREWFLDKLAKKKKVVVFMPASYTNLLQTCLINLSLKSHVDPNALALSVIFSLVCESNVGFSIKQLMKIHK